MGGIGMPKDGSHTQPRLIIAAILEFSFVGAPALIKYCAWMRSSPDPNPLCPVPHVCREKGATCCQRR
jgi:hypothetical protein